MKFARIIDGTVQELVDIDPKVLALPPLRGPASASRRMESAEIAELERLVGASLPWDMRSGGLVPVVETVKPAPEPTQLVEQIGWKVGVDKVEPIYEARTKPIPTAPSVKDLLDRIETVERDLTDVKAVTVSVPIKRP